MYSYLHYEVLPLALEAGVSTEDFWHDDEDYVYMRIEAYQRRITNVAWLNGAYALYALRQAMLDFLPIGVGKLFDKKLQDIVSEYPKSPFFVSDEEDRKEMIKQSKETKEEKFRRIANMWV